MKAKEKFWGKPIIQTLYKILKIWALSKYLRYNEIKTRIGLIRNILYNLKNNGPIEKSQMPKSEAPSTT